MLAYDNTAGLCGRVVPRMKEMLEQRAFNVELMEIDGELRDIDPEDYDGLIIGSPVRGVGWKGAGPSEAVRAFIDHIEDLDELKVALFCVYEGHPGRTLDNMAALVEERGGELVVRKAYWMLRPTKDEHVIPAECMVRIR
jgi:menaquinone-dependent protoporphyrinogen IX oxidase